MGLISSEAVLRRLQDVRNISQESIETISLWIMHYKDKSSIDVIVNGWLSCFQKASSDQQRIALFYIMNDVVQKAKNKHIDHLIPAFQPAVLAAVQIGRNSKTVKHAMERCIGIFGERQVFAKESVTTMKNLLESMDATDGDELCVELDVEELVRKLNVFQKGRHLVENALEIVRTADFDFRDCNRKARDRSEVSLLETEAKEASMQLVSLRHAMELQKKKMLSLVETLELAKRQFSHQLRDVTVAEDAYQKFYQGIRIVKSELKEMERTNVYPAATPPRDAPSPTANDDIYATGVEKVLQNLREPIRDNHDMADMEIGDEEDDISVPGPVTANAVNPYQPNQSTAFHNKFGGREYDIQVQPIPSQPGSFNSNNPIYYQNPYTDNANKQVPNYADEFKKDTYSPSYYHERDDNTRRDHWRGRGTSSDRNWGGGKRSDKGWKAGGRGKRDYRSGYRSQGSYGGYDRR